MVWLVVLIIIVLAVGGFVWWRVANRKRAMRIFLLRSRQLSDHIVQRMLVALKWETPEPLAGTPVADVWGHGIMAFEYAAPTPDFGVSRKLLDQELAQLAADENIVSSDPRFPAFVVSDFWVRSGEIHFDVAFVTNAATIEYVEDVERVNQE
ncbi:hypothetical protein [Lacticaseibacillus mingshuiensis]|uniref:hypothetical protein n=1 Tax=Lacticaseibacillus mingshuiensis TaxID=2799574 RepID=UPI001950DF52|nr:hypothetical protein [Lacticaseibacillus mingshuiensis]